MLYKKRLEAVEEELQMVRMFDSQMHIEVWPKLDYASTLFSNVTSLMFIGKLERESERISSDCCDFQECSRSSCVMLSHP